MPAPIRLSVAVIPARNPANPEFFWVKRNPVLPFMGRFHAFPGGKVDRSDSSDCVIGTKSDEEKALIFTGTREVFEETGILLVKNNSLSENKIDEARESVLDGSLDFKEFLTKHDLEIESNRFQKAGQWITPEFQPMRYDARYFCVWLTEQEINSIKIVHGELVEGEWIKPPKAYESWLSGKTLLSPPIVFIAQEFSKGKEDLMERLQNPPKVLGMANKRIEFRKGIQLFPMRTPTLPPAKHTNCYLIGEKKLSLIDPASPYKEDQNYLLNYLNNLEKYTNQVPERILLTHHHPDHIGSVNFLKEKFGIPVWAHEETARKLEGQIVIEHHLQDKEIIPIEGNFELQAIFTPGHATGHLCFLEKKSGSFIVGDMISGFGTILISPEHEGDMQLYIKSLKEMLELDFDVLLPAHGGSIGDAKGKIQQYIDHRLMREEKVLKACQTEAKTLQELVEIAYSDTPQKLWKIAELSLKAHLIKLQRENKIQGFQHLTNVEKSDFSIYEKLNS
ncbi:MAG: MBL fold metallo-hydrolase [Calditrichaeota bacterium]|nr:MAG: MBL fold metallo-hydrolase [Calditrichota bacterium]